LPVFLVNLDRIDRPSDEPAPSEYDVRSRFSPLIRDSAAVLRPHYIATKAKLNSARKHLRNLPLVWQQRQAREQTARIGLILLVATLAVSTTVGRAPSPEEKAAPIAQVVQQPIPEFDLESRLAFGRSLSDRLLSHAIEDSLEQAASPTEDPKQGADSSGASGDTLLAPLAEMDDRTWSIPFGGQNYAPTDFPSTADESFRAEVAISGLMNKTVEPVSVAQNEVQTIAPTPKAKLQKTIKRKKAFARKRPSAPINQMTAAAQPTIARQEPNLPPPPIFFFLGGPPPQAQPAGQGQ
jgi:hypothetical protein